MISADIVPALRKELVESLKLQNKGGDDAEKPASLIFDLNGSKRGSNQCNVAGNSTNVCNKTLEIISEKLKEMVGTTLLNIGSMSDASSPTADVSRFKSFIDQIQHCAKNCIEFQNVLADVRKLLECHCTSPFICIYEPILKLSIPSTPSNVPSLDPQPLHGIVLVDMIIDMILRGSRAAFSHIVNQETLLVISKDKTVNWIESCAEVRKSCGLKIAKLVESHSDFCKQFRIEQQDFDSQITELEKTDALELQKRTLMQQQQQQEEQDKKKRQQDEKLKNERQQLFEKVKKALAQKACFVLEKFSAPMPSKY